MLPVGDATVASTRWRLLVHRGALERAGFETRLAGPLARRSPPRRFWRLADLARDVAIAASADLVLVQRKMYPPPFARALRRRARALALDIDDAVDLPPPRARASGADLARYRRNFEATCAAAGLVVCGNAELAGRVPHARTAIVPTGVDAERFRPGALGPTDPFALGWVGHSDNLPYLERLAPVLVDLHRRHPALRLVVVADRAPALAGLPIEFRRWTLETELSCFSEIGVGLMPLDDTPWARSKCAFKAIQYMALGIPAVASPVGANREVIGDGVSGFLPASDGAWLATLDALLRDAALAKRIGAEGRTVVERRYALEVVSRGLVERLVELAR